MKRIITITWSFFNLLSLGLYPLWYWKSESINPDGTKNKAGYYIYGFEIKILGLAAIFGFRTFNGQFKVPKNTLFGKNIEFGEWRSKT